MEGIIKAVCISEKRGTVKKNINEVNVIKDFGLEGDAHAGKWHRQVSFLSADIVDEFNEKGASVIEGDCGENILAYGIDFKKLPVGTKLICNDAKFEITQIGKECHSHCEIYKRVGDCIMPREGIFAKVLESGTIKVGDKIEVIYPEKDMPYMAAVMTLSDKGSRGERVDTSGPRAAEILKEHGFKIVEEILLPDEEAQIKKHLIRLSDSRQVDLIITTGGTGLSPRDRTPEATLAVADRNVPGISEAIRAGSMTITKRAMLSRGVSVIRKKTLIINLPGSKKAVEESLSFIIDQLPHGLDTLRENTDDCGRNYERRQCMEISPIIISMKTATIAILFTIILGLLAARWILYRKSDATRIFWDGIFTMPLVLPPTVAGFFLLVFFGSYGPVGKLFENYLGIKIAFSWGATILAAVVMSFPLMYRSARGALEQIDEDLIFAARTLGMSEWSIFFRVMIPNALPGIISGGVLAFARGLGEFGATAMIAGNIPGRTRTLPLAVYSEVAAGNMDAAYQYVLVIVIICFAIVAAMNIYLIMEKKKQEV